MIDGPTMRRHRSKQDYATPPDFMLAVHRYFGRPSFDLAASPENTKADDFFTIQHDSLKQDWHKIPGLLWLNPPFGNIAQWSKKCHEESIHGANILFLVPASVGSNWFRDHVYQRASVYFLNGRITFVGAKDPFIKDLMLCNYRGSGTSIWRWRDYLPTP